LSASVFPPPSLSIQLLELKREKKMRAGVYPHWVTTGKIKQSVADYQCNALDGAIATLERLVAAQTTGEPGRKELIAALREAVRACEEGSECSASVIELLARVPP
jgi:hypothetical protein